MKIKTLAAAGALLTLAALYASADPLGKAFTYQGQLSVGGAPANGSYDLKFTLYDDASGGVAVAGPLTNSPVGVTNGLFTVTLDFGADVFDGNARWLGISVRTNSGPDDFALLVPRQPLLPTPHALFAANAGIAATATNLAGTLAGDVTGTQGGTSVERLRGTAVSATAPAPSQHLRFDGAAWTPAAVALATDVTGTLSVARGGTGATDASGARTSLGAAASGANADITSLSGLTTPLSIAQGGTGSGTKNFVDLATDQTIAGTKVFSPAADATGVVVRQGAGLFPLFSDVFAVQNNNGLQTWLRVDAFGRVLWTAGAVGDASGLYNLNAGNLALGTVNDTRLSANVPLKDSANTFTGMNTFSPPAGAPFAVGNANKVPSLNADLLDDLDSTAFWKTTGNGGTTPGTHFLGTTDNKPIELKVSGTRALRLEPTGSNSVNVIGGCAGNWVAPGVVAATIAGGGAGNYSGAPYTNRVEADAGTIGGGGGNTIQSGALYATIGGGVLNTIQANAQYAAITGGSVNTIAIGAAGATIAGGVGNVIGTNAAYAMIPGGASCTATGAYSFAAGRRARANHPGAFVWADSTDADVASLTNNHVRFRCQNGVRFSGGSTYANHIFWNPGDADWTVTSDRNLKENFRTVDTRAVLDRLVRLPITEWNFIGYPQRHVGPVAQDFHAAFPFTESNTAVNSGDLHGVALAAIQGLNQKLEEKEAKIKELEARLGRLEQLIYAKTISGG